MILNEEDRLALVASIAGILDPPRLEPHEITKRMLAEFKDIPLHKATNLLKRGVRLKQLKMRRVKLDGKWMNAYSEAATESVTNVEPDIDE